MRGQVLDVRKKERELRRIIVDKCGMPQETFVKDFPPNLLNLKWVEKQVASNKPWSVVMARNVPPIQELQAAVGVLFGDGDHQAQVGLDHLFLGSAAGRLALVHALVDVLKLLQGHHHLRL